VPGIGPTPGVRSLAVFDLDGTITRHDTLFPYVHGFLHRHPLRAPGALRVLPAVLRFAVGSADHGDVKAAFLRATLAGCNHSEIEGWTARFVARLLARGLFADALSAIEQHRGAGDTLVLMSASVDLYVPAIARALEFSECICTAVRWHGDRLDGALASPNRRGPEKARCLEALRARYPGTPIIAYGNGASDLEHLRLADRALLVNGSARARREAAAAGIRTLTWR
jgi:phosphatidylglycerophosphatase C